MRQAILNLPLPMFLPPVLVDKTTITMRRSHGYQIGDVLVLWQGPVTGQEGVFRVAEEVPHQPLSTFVVDAIPNAGARNRAERRRGRR